jgi:hypothetical protein
MRERRRFLVSAGSAALALATAALIDAPTSSRNRSSVAHAHDLDACPRSFAGRGTAIGASRPRRRAGDGSASRFSRVGRSCRPSSASTRRPKGTVGAFMASSSYWAPKEPALEWFLTIPFGMNPEGTTAWYHQGDGRKLWEEAYAPFDLGAAPGSHLRSTNGRVVQKEAQHDRGLQGTQDAHRGSPRRRGLRPGLGAPRSSLRPPRSSAPSSEA